MNIHLVTAGKVWETFEPFDKQCPINVHTFQTPNFVGAIVFDGWKVPYDALFCLDQPHCPLTCQNQDPARYTITIPEWKQYTFIGGPLRNYNIPSYASRLNLEIKFYCDCTSILQVWSRSENVARNFFIRRGV